MVFFSVKRMFIFLDLFFLSSLQWRSVKSLTLHTSRKTTKQMGRNGPESVICTILRQESHWFYLQGLVLFCILIWRLIWFCLLFFTENEENSLFLPSVHREKKYVYEHYGCKPLRRRPPAVGLFSDVGITETRKCGEGLAEMRTT